VVGDCCHQGDKSLDESWTTTKWCLVTRARRRWFTIGLTLRLIIDDDVQVKRVPRFWNEVFRRDEGWGEGVERQSNVVVDRDTINLKLDWYLISSVR
jgi:hypothetical protein